MRSKVVKVNGKPITLKEYKIKELKNDVLPRMGPAWQAITGGDVAELIDNFGAQLKEVFPELRDVDIDDCYPSEIEAFLEAWIDVNFSGLKRLAGPLMSLLSAAGLLPGSGLVKPSASPTIGKN